MQVRISPLGAVLGDKQRFYWTAGVNTFSTAGLGITQPILVRLELPLPVNKAAILQQSSLL